jgi:6-phosphogluconolactonase
MKRNLSFICLLILFAAIFNTSCTKNPRLFAGGFTKGDEKGLSVFEFNKRNGKLSLISENSIGENPSYFCYSDKNNLFYTINEVFEFNGEFGGGLTTFQYDPETSQLNKKNELLIPYAGPCFISFSPDSSYIFIANYPNGSVAVVKLDENGIPLNVTDTILYDKKEPDNSHAHMILHDPAGKHIYVTDLGLNKIYIYTFDSSSGKLNQIENGLVSLPSGTGPRHFAFNAEGSKLYLINEIGSTIMVFNVNGNGSLDMLQTVPTLGEGFIERNSCGDIHIGKDGKYLYGSNRGENTIVVFKIADDGLLTLAGRVPCGGKWPRNFVIDPSGKFLLVGNQQTNEISVFKINKKTGMPEKAGANYPRNGAACLKFYF